MVTPKAKPKSLRPGPLNKRPPPPGDDDVRVNARGALLGMAIGDALGCQLEGRRITMPPFPEIGLPVETELRGGGPRALKPGQVGPDIQLAAATAWSVRLAGRRYDVEKTTAHYKQWRAIAKHPDEQTVTVLDQLAPFRPDPSRMIWNHRNRRWMGNGALVRTVALSVAFAHDENARRNAVFSDVALTHFDPRCQLSSLALSAALASAFQADMPAPTAASMVEAAEAELRLCSAGFGRREPDYLREITDALEAVREDFRWAQAPDPQLYGPDLHLLQHPDSVRVAFRLAFWELFHAPNAEAGILDAVHRGGDTESHGAVTGALLGALQGEEALPSRWRDSVLEAMQTLRPDPLWDTYHPRHLLPLADWDAA